MMMKVSRQTSASWFGGIKDGKGTIYTASGALRAYPYGFAKRFEGVPGLDQATFEKFAAKAKVGCPVSKLLNAEITLSAELIQ